MVELVLDGPGKNALGTALLTDLLAQLDAAEGHAILLRGNNGALSAGVNLKEIATLDDAQMAHFLELLDTLTERLYTWPRPTVAVVDGHAIAGGAILMLACDVRIAAPSPRIRIGLTEVAVGVLFPPAVWAMVKKRLPADSLDHVILSAGLFSPEQALQVGLVDALADDALAAGQKQLAIMERYDASTYATTKQMLRGGVMDVSDADKQAFVDNVVPVWTSDALRQRLVAFLKK
jgi:enoyl-CoA hydratase/carnithine racemase